jgi:hypothetical protein
MLTFSLLTGCANNVKNSQPQITKMALSKSQQEVVDLISSLNHEILLFEYNLGDALNAMEIWVEVYHYGEYLAEVARLHVLGDQAVSLKDGRLAIEINQYGNNEFRWTIASEGARSFSDSWFAEYENMARAYESITEPVSISSGQEIILYLSMLTTGDSIRNMNDLQYYLENPEEFADYTYVQIIKARFSE